jgi:hypothetical protein
MNDGGPDGPAGEETWVGLAAGDVGPVGGTVAAGGGIQPPAIAATRMGATRRKWLCIVPIVAVRAFRRRRGTDLDPGRRVNATLTHVFELKRVMTRHSGRIRDWEARVDAEDRFEPAFDSNT